MVITRHKAKGEMGNCLMGMEFQFCKVKQF